MAEGAGEFFCPDFWAQKSPQPEKLREYIDSRLRGRTGDRRELKRAADGLFRRGFSWGDVRAAWNRLGSETWED